MDESDKSGRRGKAAGPSAAGSVRLTHRSRVYWTDAGVTKEGLADYYVGLWPVMAPFAAGRPIALLRCPDGTGGECFFQKHAWKGQSSSIRTFVDPKDKSGRPMLVVDDLEGMLGLVQGGVLEVHTWQCALRDLDHPDQIVMDLDPGEGVEWGRVIAAAFEVRERLERAGLTCFVKTSGGKGFHVVAPLKPSSGWDAIKSFTRGIAEAMAADSPDRYVATVAKSERRGRILIDYLRNGRGNTAVAAYSTRARAGAPVSMPIAWAELEAVKAANQFTVVDTPRHLASRGADPWKEFRAAEAPLPSR